MMVANNIVIAIHNNLYFVFTCLIVLHSVIYK